MQSIKAGINEDGQRLDRILQRYLPGAGKGLIYKLLRKKTIVVNDGRAEGDLRLKAGDEIKLYLADATLEQLRSSQGADRSAGRTITSGFSVGDSIVFENDDIILINKPAGILSQKAEQADVSLNEYLIGYLMDKGVVTEDSMTTFRPSVCNRLDRNTSGIVAAGKSYRGLKLLSELFRDRSLDKYYLCIVKGDVTAPAHISGFLSKDEKSNTVSVMSRVPAGKEKLFDRIETEYRPLKRAEGCTLLEVKLITGKTHQIRAHLAHEGHPAAGDRKYGDEMFNRRMRDTHHVKDQLLCAYRLVFPKREELGELSGREFRIDPPKEFFIRPDER